VKRLTILISIMAALAAPAVAQAMTGSPTMTPGGSDMAAPADASRMMAAADDMSYEALKKSNMLADSRMGSQLRKAKSTGMKVLFRDLKSAQALAARNPTVLFFAADWCPSCQADLKDINANGRRLGKVDIVVVDYDKSRDLKARYGITVQDTFVQIGKDGSKLAIWNGGGVDGILAHLVAGM
jgi:thiol-disulfide isomerase/thioredoxin